MKFDKKLLSVTPSSFRIAKDLEYAIGKALTKSDLNIGDVDIDEKDLSKSDVSMDTVMSLLKTSLHVLTDSTLETALFTCAGRAMYNKVRIDEEFFEEIENRELYYPIMFEIAKVNIGPFVGSLFSQFGGLSSLIKSGLK